MKNYTIVFDEKTKIFYKNYYGAINMDDIRSSWMDIFTNRLIPPDTKGFILNYKAATFNFSPNEHVEIAKFYQQNINVFGKFKFAILTENPRDVIIPILVREKDEGYESQPFSTLEAAIEWVLS